ncbi:hypothetical protein [Pseudovibrio exalbescens]|uniref:hypothetical protein n=1 Tax=Pseudovibrio exalbescens TaxID=197461 RepID=UPI000C9A7FF5|nr:hypothetical protein [Pseudovibrio exalbescens]
MNLRKMKKLSKRAVPLLIALGEKGEIFPAEKGENSLSSVITDKKHWSRSPARNGELASFLWDGYAYQPKCRKNNPCKFISVCPPSHPLKGTPMIGETSGYYEPEWSEETCWERLCGLVFWHYVDEKVLFDSVELVATRDFSKPHHVLAAAREMIADREKAE